MKEKFINYIKNRPSSSNSSRNYASGIEAISKKYLGIDLFSITSENEIGEVLSELNNNTEFIASNKKGHNMYSRAIKHYKEFLHEINTIGEFYDTSYTSPEEVQITDNIHKEGFIKSIKINRYERNVKSRLECLQAYNNEYKCEICGFKFSDKYGDKFKYKIHVHHIIPISEIGREYEINPKTDLIPVCPNCHMILHSKGCGGTYTVKEVREMLKSV